MEIAIVTSNVGKLKFVEANGRQFAVANIRILVHGVLNGSKGALYYPPEEIGNNIQAWNGMPMVVYHPSKEGRNISARTPEIVLSQEVGRIYNTSLDSDNSLCAEGWFDVELTKKIDSRVWNSLINGEKIEVSTGLFTDNEEAPKDSTFNGTPYAYIARNFRPDHLAILPDQIGACSVKDGCGVFNSLTTNPEWVKDHDKWIKAKEQAKTEGREDDYAYITGIYKKMGGEITPSKDNTTPQNTNNTIENTMDRTNLITWLVNNCDCYKGKSDSESKLKGLTDAEFKAVLMTNAGKAIDNEDTKFFEWMMNASDDVKSAFVKLMKKNMFSKTPKEEEGKKVVEEKPNNQMTPEEIEEEKKKKEVEIEMTGNKKQTREQYLASLPPDIREIITNAERINNNEKKKLVTQLVANITDTAKQASYAQKLMSKSITELQEMIDLLPAPTQTNNQSHNQPNYWGFQGGPVENMDSSKEPVIEDPVYNWNEWAKR